MDRVMMSGVHMTEQFQTLFICACLRLAALQEGAQLPSGLAVSALTEFPGTFLVSCAYVVLSATAWHAHCGEASSMSHACLVLLPALQVHRAQLYMCHLLQYLGSPQRNLHFRGGPQEG